MSIILALDIGTSKIAAVAYDAAVRQTAATASVANSATTAGLPAGRHEQDPERIFELAAALLRQLIRENGFDGTAVDAVAVTGQMHGVMLADPDLRPLTPLITWCDQRAAALTATIDRADWPVDRTGCYLHPGYGGATLAVLAREHAIPRNARAMTIADYIAARLSGTVATDATHAASWGIMDVRRRCWDEELLDRLGIPSAILPEIRPDLSPLGPLANGFGIRPGATVRLALGDNQAGFIGACGLGCDAMLLNLGTGGQISLPCPEFSFRPELETRPLPFGGYLMVGASLCGGRSYAILKDFFRETVRELAGRELDDAELYSAMDRLAAAAATELDVDTRFAGTRLHPETRGRIGSIGVDALTPGALCRGFTRGMIRELAGMIDRDAVRNFRQITVGGNGIRRNPLAPQFITAELGLPCVATVNREEAATGAAIAAAAAETYS